MHNNYYFLRQISLTLKNKISGWVLGACFSQEKDEIIFGFWTDEKEFYIKAILQPGFVTLTFPPDFQRAKKNSANLFKELIGKSLIDIVQASNERAFILIFEEGYKLLFKMHGNRSNIILYKKDNFVEMFHSKLVKDQTINLHSLNRPITNNFETYKENGYDLSKTFPTFGKLLNSYFSKLSFISYEENWVRVQAILDQLEHPDYYISFINDVPVLSLVPFGKIVFETKNALEAANKFYSYYTQVSLFEKEKKSAFNALEKLKIKTESYIEKACTKLIEFEKGPINEQIANILMANLHLVPPDLDQVELYDFYNDKNINIKLKKNVSPQKNAENYYKKAKNFNIELDKLKENIGYKESQLSEINTRINELFSIDNFKDLRKFTKEINLKQKGEGINEGQVLFKKYHWSGFDILVGRNAKNNDLLTQKYAHKEDLWLHAKDVKGSHVVIKHQPGKNFPDNVVEKAAQLAAYYSKRKTDSLCPVIFTLKKFVRKTKDLAEGQVIIEKENVVMVVPEDWK